MSSQPKRRRARKKARDPRSHQEEVLSELQSILTRLGELGRDVFLKKPYARDLVRSLPDLDLAIPVDFGGRGENTEKRAQEILDQLDRHLDDAILSHAAFRPGAVYSFFEDKADTDSCTPTEPRDVFCGYSETGVPQWKPLLACAIEKGSEAVEELSADRGRPVVLSFSREELLAQRLPSFGKRDRVYDIRGQIALGYYFAPAAEGAQAETKFAVTIQIIRSSTRSKVVRLGLNTLGRLPDGRNAIELLGTESPHGFVDLLRRAEMVLARINQGLKQLDPKDRLKAAEEEAKRLLSDMASGLSRQERREHWRTGHARDRAEERTRPTGMARGDLLSVRFDRFFEDRQEKTWVVLGAKGRVHVFSPTDGRHVTSLQLGKKSIEARVGKKRWLPLDRPAAAAAVQQIRAAFPDEQDVASPAQKA